MKFSLLFRKRRCQRAALLQSISAELCRQREVCQALESRVTSLEQWQSDAGARLLAREEKALQTQQQLLAGMNNLFSYNGQLPERP